MQIEIPDIKWYSKYSENRQVQARCPFASVETCPRYYQSLSLLGSAGSISIEENEDRRLKEYWEVSDLWPKTREYAASVFGPQGNPKIFLNYCPEITYEKFGYFASHLAKYTDGIDCDEADRILEKHGWSSLTPFHYTDCQLYSVLDYRYKIKIFPFYNEKPTKDEPWHESLIGKIFIGSIILLSVWVIGNLIETLF